MFGNLGFEIPTDSVVDLVRNYYDLEVSFSVNADHCHRQGVQNKV